jgi:glycosyltransferase involved in cell wall biosynthesis
MPPTVLLTTEGTYPYSRGGVSTWCQQLLEHLPEYDFRVVSLVSNPYLTPIFRPPGNVELLTIPLWGGGDIRRAVGGRRDPAGPPASLPQPDAASIDRGFLAAFLHLLEAGETDDASPAVVGGALAALHDHFQQFDYTATFGTAQVYEAFGEFLLHRPDPPAGPPHIADQKQLLSLLAKLLSPLAAGVPAADLTHATVAGWSGLFGVIAKEKWDRPLLLTEHGVFLREQLYFIENHRDLTPFSKRFLKRFIRALVLAVYSYADRVLPVCDFNARWERVLGVDESKIQVIYNGIADDYFVGDEEFASAVADSPEIISVTNINPMKDIETAIRAMGLVVERRPDARLTIYGPVRNAQYQRYCRQLVREHGLERHVHFGGPLDDVRTKMMPYSISLLVSLSEALPYTLLESMAAGQAIVATAVGGIPDALSDAGLLVRVRDYQDVAHACLQLLENRPLREQLARRARLRARHFRLDTMVGSYDAAYRAFLS